MHVLQVYKNLTIPNTKNPVMKMYFNILAAIICMSLFSCNQPDSSASDSTASEAAQPVAGGQENVKDDVSEKDVVKVAVGSGDHTTLVAALKQAELVSALSNAGPFTVESLMKDDKKADLQNILQYHVTLSALSTEYFTDGQTLGMVNGDNVTVSVKDGKVMLNNSATIVASVKASNGMVHVIDGVLLPPAKK